jgi:hypothetical protein
VPIVTHVHGQEDVADDSDGYAEAWYLPADCPNLPAGFATVRRRLAEAGAWAVPCCWL